MKRGVRCVAQTINPSNPKTCLRPKQIRKVVSADVTESCSKSKTTYFTPKVVPIRICTRQDVKRACESKVCGCPEKGLPLTKSQKLRKVLIFALKSAIMAGIVYWSCVEGVWGDLTETEDLYYRMMSVIAPARLNAEDDNDIYLPRLSDLKSRLVDAYNHAIFNVINAFANVPVKVRRTIEDVLFPPDECYEDASDSSSRE